MKTLELICEKCGDSVESLFCSELDTEGICYNCFIAKQLKKNKLKKDLTNKQISAYMS